MTVLSPPAADDAKVRIALFAPLNDDDEDLIFGSNAREISDRAENMVFFVFVFVCSFRCGSGYSSQRVYFWRLDYVSNYILLLVENIPTNTGGMKNLSRLRRRRKKKHTTFVCISVQDTKKLLYVYVMLLHAL
jgi:hypothetical protein